MSDKLNNSVDNRITKLEERVAQLEADKKQTFNSLESIRTGLGDLHSDLNSRFDEFKKSFDDQLAELKEKEKVD